MTQVRQYREPRSHVIFRHTADAIRNCHHTDGSFAQAVADEYMARVAPEERIVQFHVGTDVASIVKAQSRNAKLVERYRNGTVKLPADLEEAWVAALPDPWRADCARELAQRYGFLGATIPAGTPAAQLLSTGQLSIEFGETVKAIADVFADGDVDAHDVPRLVRAIKESHDLAAEVATATAALEHALEAVKPAGSPVPFRRAQEKS